MILLDKPYVSDFLKQTITEYSLPVFSVCSRRDLGLEDIPGLMDEYAAIEKIQAFDSAPVYTSSENCISWIAEKLSSSSLPAKIEVFKNKSKFRELIRPLYPEFYFRKVQFNELMNLPFSSITLPAVIKPVTGFFSIGVKKVTSHDGWDQALCEIQADIDRVRGIYPGAVLDPGSFIIEQYIEGEEYAFDAYFNSEGKPVILNILQHVFSSGDDVSDRVYISSRSIIQENLEPFSRFLEALGRLAKVKNFPLHVEVRCDSKGRIQPIEVNPMRFGGWCTTADLTWMAYGFNPYVYFCQGIEPDWPALLAVNDDSLFSIIVLDNSTGVRAEEIISFDYEKLLQGFECPLELRRVDHRVFAIFGFLFAKTSPENRAELDRILHSDLREFVLVDGGVIGR